MEITITITTDQMAYLEKLSATTHGIPDNGRGLDPQEYLQGVVDRALTPLREAGEDRSYG